MADALDVAIAETSLLPARDPRWWRVVGFVQGLLLGLATVGGLWLAGLAVAGYLQLSSPDLPRLGGAPLPTVLVMAGTVLGLVLAGVARVLARFGARRQARQVTERLRGAVAEVAERLVVVPVDEVLSALVRTRDAAEAAAGGNRSRRGDA